MKKVIKPIVLAVLAAIVSVAGVVSHNWEGVASVRDKEIPGNNINSQNVKYEVLGFGTIAKSTDGGKTWESK
jgi:photosystem II stability/assembly factor-like uncharacterized protein